MFFVAETTAFAQSDSWDTYSSDNSDYQQDPYYADSKPADPYTYTSPSATVPQKTTTTTMITTTTSAPATSTGTSSSTTAVAPEPAVPSQVLRLIEGGNLEQARTKLFSRLNQVYSSSDKKQIEEKISEVNVKLLFSDKEYSDIEVYSVRPGDSLYKIAKKYDTPISLIKKMNSLEQDTIFPDQKLRVLKGNFSVLVDKSENVMKVLLNEQLFKRYVVATGASGSNTPEGTFTVVNKLKNPTWYKAGAVVPPNSPDNLLGTRWLGFSKKGYGIHGTVSPESIGKHSTSGCVRMLNQDVEELYELIPQGTQVIVAA